MRFRMREPTWTNFSLDESQIKTLTRWLQVGTRAKGDVKSVLKALQSWDTGDGILAPVSDYHSTLSPLQRTLLSELATVAVNRPALAKYVFEALTAAVTHLRHTSNTRAAYRTRDLSETAESTNIYEDTMESTFRQQVLHACCEPICGLENISHKEVAMVLSFVVNEFFLKYEPCATSTMEMISRLFAGRPSSKAQLMLVLPLLLPTRNSGHERSSLPGHVEAAVEQLAARLLVECEWTGEELLEAVPNITQAIGDASNLAYNWYRSQRCDYYSASLLEAFLKVLADVEPETQVCCLEVAFGTRLHAACTCNRFTLATVLKLCPEAQAHVFAAVMPGLSNSVAADVREYLSNAILQDEL